LPAALAASAIASVATIKSCFIVVFLFWFEYWLSV
jgi:hypothetical protein